MNINDFRLVDRKTGKAVKSNRQPRQSRKVIRAPGMVDTRNAAMYLSPIMYEQYTRQGIGNHLAKKFSCHSNRGNHE